MRSDGRDGKAPRLTATAQSRPFAAERPSEARGADLQHEALVASRRVTCSRPNRARSPRSIHATRARTDSTSRSVAFAAGDVLAAQSRPPSPPSIHATRAPTYRTSRSSPSRRVTCSRARIAPIRHAASIRRGRGPTARGVRCLRGGDVLAAQSLRRPASTRRGALARGVRRLRGGDVLAANRAPWPRSIATRAPPYSTTRSVAFAAGCRARGPIAPLRHPASTRRGCHLQDEALVPFAPRDVFAVQEFEEGNRVFARDAGPLFEGGHVKTLRFPGGENSRSLSIAERWKTRSSLTRARRFSRSRIGKQRARTRGLDAGFRQHLGHRRRPRGRLTRTRPRSRRGPAPHLLSA